MNRVLRADAYIEYIRVQKRYSLRTQQLYMDALRRYWMYIFEVADEAALEEEVNKELKKRCFSLEEALSVKCIRGYVAECFKAGKMEARSINLHLSALSGYCNWLLKLGELRSNPVKGIPRPKEKHRLPHFFRSEALERYCVEPFSEDYDYSVLRDRLMVMMIYATGMRRMEIASLTVGMVDLGRKVFKIIGKGDKEREIPFNQVLYEKIFVYLQKRTETFAADAGDSFFLTDKGTPLYLNFVNNVVKKELAGLRGIEGKISPHVLRHSFATHLLNNGAGLNSIKEVLGHSSLAATQVYTHNTFGQLEKIYLTAHPRAKKGG